MTTVAIQTYFQELRDVVDRVGREKVDQIRQSVQLLTACLRCGGKVLIMGNGGSAADAQHFAAELVGRFLMERKALPSIALTTDTSILTAVGNDYGFDEIFKRQIEALADPRDVVIGLSTSGMSNNVFHALTAANQVGCKTIGLLGREGGSIASIVDVNLTVPEHHTPYIQTAHGAVLHLFCDLLEKELFTPSGQTE
ncbi:D-sedoheptulose-7-phosphate isomerase [Syntrophotalea carbinolica DSM 2380]|uniref:Phosphoheptose isomerase n=1 Tax=Syntrophotalea carbinolica (strain DSM 2380 / NBRC 103641 / GraBd1) TaxID=338963 RepID=GMHA_SYNC1|nr:D-sedoheptulose 7-phosphate isomerase [Syntrophotalea carbinolica]Q3A538.1 RecName: Full=Phosphoheptose isomerase; AltName: Full=Sedoheptulose 7-phosphate isomerase [Syntrophotalea carbinolica DSM 2380]ABA88519.1 D-sedoheptulose-7-phosphate isomerase [Syntrophotalea carbinolica DSM 2380]